MIIRKETPGDINRVYHVVESAFRNETFSDHDEHNLVNRLRQSASFIPELSLVAEEDGEVVGYILFTKIKVGDDELLALAPVAVLPDRQGKRIGTKLIEAGHEQAKKLGYTACIVMGHDKYYPRFGYHPASEFCIKAPFEVEDKSFMAIELCENSLQGISGVVEYAKEFFE